MVDVLTVSSGYSPEYLLKEVATGRENYYTGAVTEGEPPGRWWGRGAEQLGLTGLVEAQDMRAVFERFLDPRADGFGNPDRWDEVGTLGHTGRKFSTEDELYNTALEREPNASPERRAELRVEAGKKVRQNVAFHDVTFSVQKSVTLLHTAFEAQEHKARTAGDTETAEAWGRFRSAVEDAIWAGNNAALDYLSDKAGYSRVGHHGGAAGRYVDAHDWIGTSFFQHDSRDHDPQLHIHNPILNRVQGPDGQWRTLDGRALYRWRGAAGAVAERTTEERLTHALGMVFATRPDGKAREVVGVSPEAMALISSRRRDVTAKAAELIEGFETRFGRAPNNLERDRLARQATFATRRAKSHDGETREQVLDRVDRQLRAEVADGLSGIARTALAARGDGPQVREWSPQAVIETALAEVQTRKSGWTRSDLIRAINAALPDYLGTADGRDVGSLLDQLADEAVRYAVPLDATRPAEQALPAELRLADGSSAYQAPGGQLFATPEHVRTERILVGATAEGGAPVVAPPAVDRFLSTLRESGIELGVDQAAAVRGVLTSGARVESLVGPAGTGKSFVVGTLARAWSTHPDPDSGAERRVFGLATSQIATEVLSGEGLTARNVARWLATQDRLTAPEAEGRASGDDSVWRLRAGDLVVVDESAMTDTAALAAIHRHVDTAGAKLLLVGDHRQLAAVGAGGGMDLLATSGARYELADARRFRDPWERAASLRLRAGDESVLREYHQHGRLLDAGTTDEAEQSATRAWLGDTLAGKRSLLLVDSNDQAARLSATLRAELVRLGRVESNGVPLGLQGTYAGVGDLVEARANAWDLAGVDGNRRGPINRETYRVTATRPDGSLEVTPDLDTAPTIDSERIVLPAGYVRENLALAYASTVHSAQGTTVDTSHTVVTPRTSRSALYVGMSRGRDDNTAHITTRTGPDDAADGTDAHQVRRDPVAALAAVLNDTDQTATRSALATATESADENASVRTPAELLADAATLAATQRTATWLDELTADGTLAFRDRARVAAEDGAASLTRVLRSAEIAGHDARQVLRDAIADRPLGGVRNATNVIYHRITEAHRFDPAGDTWADWTPNIPDPGWQHYLNELATAADRRAAQLGAQAAETAPAWAVAAFGEAPDDPTTRDRWIGDVGRVAAYRELRGHDSDDDALGPAPKPGQVEQFAAYRAAWRSLGRPEIDREELELSDGQLRVRIRAAEREAAWAPRYVGNELAGTRHALATHRQTAAVRAAEAESASTEARLDLQGQAAEAAALAEVLDERSEQLAQLDDARSRWLAHTAATRAAADRARAELALRRAGAEPEQQVTADDWLAAHREADAVEDSHREITEDYQLLDRQDDRFDEPAPPGWDDVREESTREHQLEEDAVRVPSAEEIITSLDRAHRALAEINTRDAYDAGRTAEERAADLNRWSADDSAAEEELTLVDEG
ncbi:MobF family relaxase [Pseudonocardia sp. N23]|uniref:MobF family relaxase n=1 Tax=Pseudonocardia sp. N23 TaxID=1987376 RepID=UPI000BFC463E|nr:MobF family relaxase [Pseudonocardia sp. N23]GAY09628.1 relaxase TrwC/conjugal transfer protein TraA/DNA primase, conjugative [Pseudonocardia sp. N23]